MNEDGFSWRMLEASGSFTSFGPPLGTSAASLLLRARSVPQRILLCFLLFVVLVLSNSYQGSLLGFLTTPPSNPDPQSLVDGLSTVRTVFGHSVLAAFHDPEASAGVRVTAAKMRIKPFEESLLVPRRILQLEPIGWLHSEFFIDFFSRQRDLSPDGEKHFHMIPECINPPGFVAYCSRAGSAAKDVFADFASRVTESGLYMHHLLAQRHLMDVEGVTAPTARRSKREPMALSVGQVAGPLLLLVSGLSLATTAMLAECIRARWSRRMTALLRRS